jgi:hypothetical protein
MNFEISSARNLRTYAQETCTPFRNQTIPNFHLDRGGRHGHRF